MSESGKKISLPIVGAEQSAQPTGKSRAEGGDVMSEIGGEVAAHKVVLYMKGTPEAPMCGFSHRAAAILTSYGVPLYAVNILEDPEKRQAIKEFSDWPTIPQIYVGGEFLGGSDILMQMHQTGQLEDVLKGTFGAD
jgi:monothiol glutaredoxin